MKRSILDPLMAASFMTMFAGLPALSLPASTVRTRKPPRPVGATLTPEQRAWNDAIVASTPVSDKEHRKGLIRSLGRRQGIRTMKEQRRLASEHRQ